MYTRMTFQPYSGTCYWSQCRASTSLKQPTPGPQIAQRHCGPPLQCSHFFLRPMVAVWFHCIIRCACQRYACTPVSLVCLHCMVQHTHTCTYYAGHGYWGRRLPGLQQLERCLYQPSCFLPRRQYQWTQSISTAVDPAKGKISCIGWRTKSELWLSNAPFIGLVRQVLVPCGVLQWNKESALLHVSGK